MFPKIKPTLYSWASIHNNLKKLEKMGGDPNDFSLRWAKNPIMAGIMKNADRTTKKCSRNIKPYPASSQLSKANKWILMRWPQCLWAWGPSNCINVNKIDVIYLIFHDNSTLHW